jgi:hypothetical protein
MKIPAGAPIAPEDWDETWRDFARTWAYGRIENGPSWSAETAAIKMFTGDRRYIAAWVITQARWQEQPEVLKLRNSIESKLTASDTESLCDADAVKTKVTKSMLDIMTSTFVDPKDRVGAGKLLADIYGLVDARDETPPGGSGAILIQMPSTDDFEKMAFAQQQRLEKTIEGRLVEIEDKRGDK